jgi:CubicO group peptidase (beta-lactamase class C family)
VLCYHGWTYGFLLGEIMRRVDGRKPAQFFREEIAEKADIDFQMGLVSQHDCARLAAEDWLWPSLGARAAVWNSFALDVPALRINWEDRRAEVPAANGYANGRSIARVCAIGALGGELDGVRFLSESILAEAAREQIYAECPVLGWVRFGLGFGLHSKEFPAPSPTTLQWGGWGGSVGMMDPAAKFSYGYATNHHVVGPLDDARRVRLRQALGEVITRL